MESEALLNFTVNKPKHLSASTINSFIAYRADWFMSKILGQRGKGNPAMFRGTSVEHGVNHFVDHRPKWDSPFMSEQDVELMYNCVEEGQRKFKELCLEAGESPTAMLKSIADGVAKAIPTLVEIWGSNKPDTQHKLTFRLPGVEIPIIGFLDYLESWHTTIRDMKVSARSPSYDKYLERYKLKQDYQIQGALYKHATGHDVIFHFFVPLKTECKEFAIPLVDEDYHWALEYATMAANRIEKIYDIMDKPWVFQKPDDIAEVFAAMAFPNLDAFWNDKDREFAQAIWGIAQKEQTKKNPFAMPDDPTGGYL